MPGAIADGPANEVGMGVVAQGGVEHFFDWGESGGVGGVFEGAEDGRAVVVGEIELAGRAGEEIVVYYSCDFAATGLVFGGVPDELLGSGNGGFHGRDGELDVVEGLRVLVCEFGVDFVAAPGVTVGDVFAHDVDFVGGDHAQPVLLFYGGCAPRPARGEGSFHLCDAPEALEVVDHPEVELEVFGIVGDVG